MKKNFAISLALVAAICSCSKENVEGPVSPAKPEIQRGESSILCSTPVSDATKTSYGTAHDGVYPVAWVTTDYLMVYSSDGSDSDTFSNSLESGQKVTDTEFFADNSGVAGPSRVAVYPSTRAKGFDGGKLSIDFSVLKKQVNHSTLANNSQNIAYFPMYAVEDAATAGKFVFNNLIGCFNFQLSDYQGLGMKISKVKVTSASLGIAGTGTVSVADGSIALPASNGSNNSITVEYEAGTSIKTGDPSKSVECYVIGLPATSYPAGDLTFEFTDLDGRVFTQTLSKPSTLAPGKIKKTAKLLFTLTYGTANSYIVAPGATASIDVTPKYTFSDRFDVASLRNVEGTTPELSCEILWQQHPLNTNGGIISSASITGNTLSVTASSTEGNALVAIKNGDVIVWSYHIWVTDTPSDLTYVIGSDSFQMMDRNLGATMAVPAVAGDARYMFGLLYQWGRKDPMVTYSATSTTRTFNAAISCEAATSKNIAWAIQNPTVDLTLSNSTWLPLGTDKTAFASLWGAPSGLTTESDVSLLNIERSDVPYVKTVYDPCPEGYQVPEGWCFHGLTLTEIPDRDGTYYCMHMVYDGTNTTAYPLAGCVSSAATTMTMASMATRGYYWSATPRLADGKTSHLLQLVWANSKGQLSSNQYNPQACPCSIRCVKTSSIY